MLKAWTWIRRRRATSDAVLNKEDFDIFRGDYHQQREGGFRPRNGSPPVRLELPLDWAMDPLNDRNWCFHLHAWRMVDPIWREFHGSDWDRLRAEVMPWVRDWYRFHVVEMRVAPFSWYDMSAGFRAQHLAMLLSLHHSGSMKLSKPDVKVVRDLAILHHDRLRDASFIAPSNHGVFQILGLRLLGAACESYPEFAGEPAYSSKMLLRLLGTQFDERGVHVENSPEYHGLILKQFGRLRPELFPSISSPLAKMVRKAREVLPWFTLPDGRIAPIGDSEGLGAGLGVRAKGDHQITSGDGHPVLIRDLARSGYVVVRTAAEVPEQDASMLIMRGRSPSITHAHVDGLSIVLFDRGRILLTDPGKYTYAKGAWRDYFTSDRAHNVVGVKGTRMGPHHLPPASEDMLEVAEVAGDSVRLDGSVTRRDWFRHSRSVRYVPSRRVEVVDRISARDDDSPVVYWHLAPGIDAERAQGGVNIYDNGAFLARLSTSDPKIKARLVYGQEEPIIQGWVSSRYGKKVPASVIEFHCPPGTSVVETTIELRDGSRPKPHGAMPRRLTHGVRFNFPHRFHRDRTVLLPDGHTQRRVIVKVMEADTKRIVRRLTAAMTAKGFVASRPREASDSLRLGYTHPDGTKVIAKLRGPTAEAGAGCGSLYFAWSRIGRGAAPGKSPSE